jgi:malate dehydrogenase (oxaloacetate-decarboxylating)(NADP+)
VAAAFCAPIAKASSSAPPSHRHERADRQGHRRQRERDRRRPAEPHQAARDHHADQKRRDDGDVEQSLQPSGLDDRNGKQDRVAGHLSGKGAKLQKADGVRVACDHHEQGGFQRGRAHAIGEIFPVRSHASHRAQFINRSLTVQANLRRRALALLTEPTVGPRITGIPATHLSPDRITTMAQSHSLAYMPGMELLQEPRLNKSTAFAEAEREALGLTGLLPDVVESEDVQLKRVLAQLAHKTSDLDRYIYLVGLLDHNETLFYRTAMSDPARFLPIVYDPTVGEACQKFGHIFRRPRGMYLSIKHKGRVKEILRNWPEPDVRFICATSGERILGLGDLGANGMGIPIGKLQLYTACAGVPPDILLPMVIDFGTNNQSLLDDPLYLGIRAPRASVAGRDAFVQEFVEAVQEVFPRCCIHFEDWAGVDAVRLLDRYRDQVCCYNDDIQGTAGAALVGIFSALRVTGGKLADQRVLFLGAGSAGTGIAGMVVEALMLEGLGEVAARSRISMFDVNGLLEASRQDLLEFQKPYAHNYAPTKDFVAAIDAIKPTAIIGVSTCAKAFDQRVVAAMSRLNQRPIIFALSNPTDHAECTAEEAYNWSDGRALFAAGVPFDPVNYKGKTFVPGQGNNLYVFPAVALAVYATQARRVPDALFIAAARGVAEQVTPAELDSGLLYPPQSNILATEMNAAVRVAEEIFELRLAGVEKPDDMAGFIASHMYKPEYEPAR